MLGSGEVDGHIVTTGASADPSRSSESWGGPTRQACTDPLVTGCRISLGQEAWTEGNAYRVTQL